MLLWYWTDLDTHPYLFITLENTRPVPVVDKFIFLQKYICMSLYSFLSILIFIIRRANKIQRNISLIFIYSFILWLLSLHIFFVFYHPQAVFIKKCYFEISPEILKHILKLHSNTFVLVRNPGSNMSYWLNVQTNRGNQSPPTETKMKIKLFMEVFFIVPLYMYSEFPTNIIDDKGRKLV